MTADYESADGDRFEVDERGQPRFQSPFPTSWGAVPAVAEERRTWIADHARALPLTGKQALFETPAKVEVRTKTKVERRTGDMSDNLTKEARQDAGRYDGVLIKDLGARVEMDQLAMQAWRAGNNVVLVPEFDARLRAVAATNPQAAAANGLFNQGFSVVPIDEGGVPLTQPTRDPEQLASWWEAGGPYADRWPAVPCEQGGLFGLLVYPGAGRDWFVKAATVHEPSRVERLMATLDRVTELGVPPLTGDDWDDEPQQPKPDEVRAPMDAKLWLVEDVPAHKPAMRAWTGPIRGRAGQAAMAAARPAVPRQLTAMVWAWPPGQSLPVGRELRKGVESLSVIPAWGAVLEIGGVRFVVRQVPALLSPPPDWLIAELQKFGGRP